MMQKQSTKKNYFIFAGQLPLNGGRVKLNNFRSRSLIGIDKLSLISNKNHFGGHLIHLSDLTGRNKPKYRSIWIVFQIYFETKFQVKPIPNSSLPVCLFAHRRAILRSRPLGK